MMSSGVPFRVRHRSQCSRADRCASCAGWRQIAASRADRCGLLQPQDACRLQAATAGNASTGFCACLGAVVNVEHPHANVTRVCSYGASRLAAVNASVSTHASLWCWPQRLFGANCGGWNAAKAGSDPPASYFNTQTARPVQGRKNLGAGNATMFSRTRPAPKANTARQMARLFPGPHAGARTPRRRGDFAARACCAAPRHYKDGTRPRRLAGGAGAGRST